MAFFSRKRILLRMEENKSRGDLIHHLLYFFSVLYKYSGILIKKLYQFRLLKSYRVSVPVISIGNITVGGTGKTPLTLWIAEFLVSIGKKPLIVLRGYRGLKEEQFVVSDGKRIFRKKGVSDEALMMAELLKDCVVICGKQRWRSAFYGVKEYGCDVVIIDDGYTHFALKRDLDIVLIDAQRPFGNYKIVPCGILREPLSALSRADWVVITKAVDKNQKDRLLPIVKQITDVEISVSVNVVTGYLNYKTGKQCSNELIRDKKVIGFCGIGNPNQFFETIKKDGLNLLRTVIFPDHHSYSEEELNRLIQIKKETGADCFVCTEKDAVNLPIDIGDIEIYVCRSIVKIDESFKLKNRIKKLFNN